MADQNSRVAALPAGYVTLVGVVYAVAASSSKIWSRIAWARMSGVRTGNRTTADPLLTPQSPADEAERARASIRYVLSSTITRSIRRLGSGGSDGTAELIAVLHLLCSNATINAVHGQPLDEERPSVKGDRSPGEAAPRPLRPIRNRRTEPTRTH